MATDLLWLPPYCCLVDVIYENLSYCASLHQDEDADQDYDMDDEDIYEDDINDHEGLYADADIQGGYIPKSTSATAIGHSEAHLDTHGDTILDQIPGIDLQSGEWYTGNPATDATFQLSEQGQVMLQQWNKAAHRESVDCQSVVLKGKRGREEGQECDMEAEEEQIAGANEAAEEDVSNSEAYTEEDHQEARSKMWRVY
jgi:hypothetical protein